MGCIGSTWSFHSGQICTAPTRAVVQRGVFDQVVERLRGYAGALKVGDPTERDTSSARSSPRPSATGSSATSPAGVDEGAELVVGGGRPPHLERGLLRGADLARRRQRHDGGPPGDLRSGRRGHPLRRRGRGRGPGQRQRLRPLRLRLLADTSRAFAWRRQLRAGHVGINTAQRNHEAPFGGFKMSGVGRDGGDFGLEAYSEMQSIVWSS